MAAALDIRNPVDVRRAGMRALTRELGYEGMRAFISQYEGTGDWTKERHEQPELGFEALTAELEKVDAEMKANGEYGVP